MGRSMGRSIIHHPSSSIIHAARVQAWHRLAAPSAAFFHFNFPETAPPTPLLHCSTPLMRRASQLGLVQQPLPPSLPTASPPCEAKPSKSSEQASPARPNHRSAHSTPCTSLHPRWPFSKPARLNYPCTPPHPCLNAWGANQTARWRLNSQLRERAQNKNERRCKRLARIRILMRSSPCGISIAMTQWLHDPRRPPLLARMANSAPPLPSPPLP